MWHTCIFSSVRAPHRLQFDLDSGSEREASDGDGRSSRILAVEVLCVDGVHRGKVIHVHQEDVDLDYLAPATAGRMKDDAEIVEDARRLHLDPTADQLPGLRIDGRLPGEEQQSVGQAARLGLWAHRRRSTLGHHIVRFHQGRSSVRRCALEKTLPRVCLKRL